MLALRSFGTVPDFFYWLQEQMSGQYPTNAPHIPLYSFGFFVALSFIISAIPLVREMKRRKELLVSAPTYVKWVEGEAPKLKDIYSTLFVGFLVGWKLIPLFFGWAEVGDEMQLYLLSLKGNLPAGLLCAAALGGYEWYSKKKKQLPKPIEHTKAVYPHDNLGEIIFIVAVFGVIGANALEILNRPTEYWRDFIENPIMSLFSGFTIVGALLFGIVAMYVYSKVKKIHTLHLFDSMSAIFMLAYAIGRQGCQWSGDGDWGIATTGFTQPSFIPDWLWGQTYAHNVIYEGVPIPGCTEQYCTVLAEPHFPTPIYETILSLGIFFFLWGIRKRITHIPGLLFAFFCILNGLERFFIEFIRETDKKAWAFNMSEQQIVSVGLIITGIICTVLFLRKSKKTTESGTAPPAS